MFGIDGENSELAINIADNVQYETLRLYGPVVMMPRYTGDSNQRLTINGKEHVLPAHTSVTLNFMALHTHSKHWGPDPLTFRPDRWILPAEKRSSESPLFQPFAGSFIPWNLGPRVCPGKKFAQVEFVRSLFSLFAYGSRVELVKEVKENDREVKERVLRIMEEAKVEVTLKMMDAHRIRLKWVKK